MVYDPNANRRTSARCSLNPYSSGLWSTIILEARKRMWAHVLILILLDYGLRLKVTLKFICDDNKGLNPYSSGLWSTMRDVKRRSLHRAPVLILILLDYGLRSSTTLCEAITEAMGLNPYSSGLWSTMQNMKIIAMLSLSLNPYSSGLWSTICSTRGQ
mgnify:CR=1 FL=1